MRGCVVVAAGCDRASRVAYGHLDCQPDAKPHPCIQRRSSPLAYGQTDLCAPFRSADADTHCNVDLYAHANAYNGS